MSETTNNALFAIVWQLAIKLKESSIEVGANTFYPCEPVEPVKGRPKPEKPKYDSVIFDAAVLVLTADVEWQRVWKWIEDAHKSGNPNLAYEIVKRNFPLYRRICNAIWDELLSTLRSRNEAALETSRPGPSIPEDIQDYFERNKERLIAEIEAAAIKDHFEKNKEGLIAELAENPSKEARRALGLEVTKRILGSKRVKPDDRVMRHLRKPVMQHLHTQLKKEGITSGKASKKNTSRVTKNDHGRN
jgi:hypothetical protein